MAAPADDTGNTGNDDGCQHTGNESNQSNHSRGLADSPAPISLALRAPAGPIATRTWHMYLRHNLGLVEYKNLLEQKNQCIRSRLAHVSLTNKMGPHVQLGGFISQVAAESTNFPYPTAFQKMFRVQSGVQVQTQAHDEENRGRDLGDNAAPGQNNLAHEGARTPVMPDAGGYGEHVRVEWRLSLTSRWFGITRTTAIESETHVQPLYVVLGIFPRGHSNPRERVVFIHKPKQLLWGLRWAAFRLRGLSTFFSLIHVKSFRLYRCDAEKGIHERIDLDSNGVADLQLLMDTYKNWYVPSYITQAWANWIHQTLNNGSHDVLKGTYALELVLDWSVTRISIVVLLPVLLSLAIGLWLNASAWTDLATIQTAWGTASYVVTAGGLLAALLGILSSIADK